MHIAWTRAQGQLETCPLCVEAVGDIPYERRVTLSFPLPCPEHGDPSALMPENYDAWEIYAHMHPGAHIYLEMQQGDKTIRKPYLNLPVIESLCRAYDCDFLATLDKLEIMHKELTE